MMFNTRRLTIILIFSLFSGLIAPTPLVAQTPTIIAIDPGHGGNDYGAIGKRKRAEKTINLAISRQLQYLINLTPYLSARLTRQGDYYLRLKTRIDKARDYKATLLISIHADAAHSSKPRGASIYILSARGEQSAANIWLEQRENRDAFVSGLDLSDTNTSLADVLIDLAQNKTHQHSLMLANAILSALTQVTALHKKTVQRANFIILKAPDIPSVLIETGFITNPVDAKNLANPAYQNRIAAAILMGIIHYLNNHPRPNTHISTRKIPNYLLYRVKRGDNLSEIGNTFGISSKRLKKIASLRRTTLKVNQTLKIPFSAF